MESEKKISVCLTFDFDAISLWLGGFRASSLSAISRGEFGRVGAERLIAMLREWGIRSTWFIPGHSAETYPQIVERLVADGHEIANHGYLHSHPKSPEDEAAILDRGNEVLTRMTGGARSVTARPAPVSATTWSSCCAIAASFTTRA